MKLRIIGLNATLGDLDENAKQGTETGILAIVTADNQNTAQEVTKIANPYLLNHPLSEQIEMPTFASHFAPNEMLRCEIYEICLKHIMILKDPIEAFHLTVEEMSM